MHQQRRVSRFGRSGNQSECTGWFDSCRMQAELRGNTSYPWNGTGHRNRKRIKEEKKWN